MTITLALTAEGDWARHASAMLHSALSRTPDADFECCVMFGEDAVPQGIERLEATGEDFGARMRRLPVPLALLDGFSTRHFHRAAWYRVLLPELLPQNKRALYLDADTIVRRSLVPLWETALDGAPFAAATNPLYPFMPNWPRERLGVPEARRYINTGVLLLDLETMRRDAVVAAVRAYARKHPENTCPEQDALSALYHAQLKLLHPQWNVQNAVFELSNKHLPLTTEECESARNDPSIVHFIAFKPWQYVCTHPLRGLYHEHLAQTSWPAKALEGGTLFNRCLRPLSVRWRHYAMRAERRLRGERNRLRRLLRGRS